MATYDKQTKAKNIMERIRKLLINLDMSIEWAKGEIKLRESNIKLNTNLPNPKKYNIIRAKEAQIEKLKAEIYIQECERNKRELISGINIILDQYEPRYKDIFIMYYFSKSTYEEIADATFYSRDSVNKIIQIFHKEILNFYE